MRKMRKAGNIRRAVQAAAIYSGILVMHLAVAQPYSIAAENLDEKKIYYGTASEFSQPAEIDYKRLIQATPEYQEVKDENIERGTGKYWILLSRASNRVVNVVSEVGESSDYDLIAALGYLGGLDPSIPAEDITETVLEALETSAK